MAFLLKSYLFIVNVPVIDNNDFLVCFQTWMSKWTKFTCLPGLTVPITAWLSGMNTKLRFKQADVYCEKQTGSWYELLYLVADCRGQTVLHGASNAIAVLERDEQGSFRMRRTLSVNGHTDKVNCVRWVQDNIFLSGSVDKSAILWRDLKPGLTYHASLFCENLCVNDFQK